MPHNNEVLRSAAFADFCNRLESDEQQIMNFVKRQVRKKIVEVLTTCHFISRFATLLPFASLAEQVRISEELSAYQRLDDSFIPPAVLSSAKVGEEKCFTLSIGPHLELLGYSERPDGRKAFPRLSAVAKLVLVLPHSNAGEEKVFSLVRKNKTPFRANLSVEGTLPNFLATVVPCHKFEPPDAVIEKSKKVTWDYNKKHRK